jgi:enoyl-CoA hydratase/carnithine racemase
VPFTEIADIVPQTGTFIANQWMLTGKKMSAAHALHLGLLSQVCKQEELDSVTKEYCSELLTSYVVLSLLWHASCCLVSQRLVRSAYSHYIVHQEQWRM